MGECRYGKKHSLFWVISSYDHATGCSTSVYWCEVCGQLVQKEFALENESWKEKTKTEKIPQISKEILGAEKKNFFGIRKTF